MKFRFLGLAFALLFVAFTKPLLSQESQTQTQLKVKQLIEKKAEYHRLTGGEQDGYRIKIHFGADKDKERSVKSKFQQRFADIYTYEEYQQPNWVVLVGDFKTKLEAFQTLKKIQSDFPSSFIVKGKIKLR
ncbi:MAG: SPOR domain-containing protein [Bacteroidota bacterium]|nr:SPOR domain-containing protein [Bacteroidota bacterium]